MPIYSRPKAVYKVSRELLRLPNVRPSPYSRGLNGRVECTLCRRRCRLGEGAVGVCGTRFNLGGTLYTAAYGLLTAAESRPIEIKPLYHFYPGTSAMTISTWGCNFPVPGARNGTPAKSPPPQPAHTWSPRG